MNNRLEEIKKLLPDNDNGEITEKNMRDAFAMTFDEIDEKIDKPTEEGTTATHPYVFGLDRKNNPVKLPAGDLGKNFSNTNLTFTEHRSHNLNGQNLSFTGGKVGFGVAVPTEAVDVSGRVKADAVILNTNNSSAIANRLRTNGTFLYHANSSALEKRLMYYDATDITNLLKSMNDNQKEEWRRALLKAGEGYSTGQPRVDFILPFKLTKEIKGIQYVSVIGSNLLLNTNDCEVVLINVATRQEWRVDVINTSASTTSQFSFGFDFENLPLGSYRLRVRNGTMTNIDTTSFEVVESVISRNLSGLNWQTWMFRSDLQNFTANGIRIHRPSKQEAVNEGDSRAQINAYKALSDIILNEDDANKNWNLIISVNRNNGFSHGDRNVGNRAGYIGVVTSDNLTEGLLPDYGMKWQHQDTYNHPNVGRHIGVVDTSVNSSLLFSKKGAIISVFQLINGKDTLVSTYNIVDKLPALRLLFSDGGIPNGYDWGYSVDVMIESLVVEN